MGCQCQILHIRWFDLITNAAVTLRTRLSTITDIIPCHRTALFGHVAPLGSHSPAHGALACAVAHCTERRAPND